MYGSWAHGRQIFFRGGPGGGGVTFVDPIFNGQFFSKKFKNKLPKNTIN
jgi:hypothetical protein